MRDTILWRLCQKECAWIDCDTKYEWISYIRNDEMKITKRQLKQIIKEELEEGGYAGYAEPSDEVVSYEPYYGDDVNVDSAKLAADMKNALKNFSTEQIVSELEQGLQFLDKPGREAFIAIAEIFDDLGKPHHGKHQDI
jgi:hypothetical protein